MIAWWVCRSIRCGGRLTRGPLSEAQARFVETLRRLGASPEVIVAALKGEDWMVEHTNGGHA